jgi:hypothetical protein
VVRFLLSGRFRSLYFVGRKAQAVKGKVRTLYPEHRGLLHCDQVNHCGRLLACLLGREGGDDLLEARIFAQRIPASNAFHLRSPNDFS